MPHIELVFYQEESGEVPVLLWLLEMGRRDRRIVAKCQVKMEYLAEVGHEIKRPDAEYLRDNIYELRVRLGSVNYRILYFFDGRSAVVLVAGLTKEGKVPDREINLAVERRQKYLEAPDKHRYIEEG